MGQSAMVSVTICLPYTRIFKCNKLRPEGNYVTVRGVSPARHEKLPANLGHREG